MAFDRPLEADRVDDLGLFSSFIRAPVVGTLMWILGGDMAKKREEEEKQKQLVEAGGDNSASEDPSAPCAQPLHVHRYMETNHQLRSGLKRMPPRLVGSDISNFGECAVEMEALALHQSSSSFESHIPFNSSKERKMSWSDESGQSLVHYIEESATTETKAIPSASLTPAFASKPVKSAMKRSSSNVDREDSLRYIPKGLGGGHSGLVMPKKPFADATTGYISPEWGWYINTTPPTPEMYYNQHSANAVKKPSMMDAHRAAGSTRRSQPSVTASVHPHFSNAGNSSATTSRGWPSVPL